MGYGSEAILAYSAIAAAAVSTGASVYSADQTGKAQSAAANYQAAVARNNQTQADYNAKVATATGDQEEAAKREQTAQVLGMQRAAIGASGLDPNTGTPLRLGEDVARLGELDAATIRENAERAAYGFKTQGLSYSGQAALDSSQASYATRAGQLGAFTSLVGGASSVSSKYLTYQQYGVV